MFRNGIILANLSKIQFLKTFHSEAFGTTKTLLNGFYTQSKIKYCELKNKNNEFFFVNEFTILHNVDL